MPDAYGVPTNFELARMAIPRARFFLVVLMSSIMLQYFIAGLRYEGTRDVDTRVLPRSALVVTAHPDDEAMFFGPAIMALTAAGVKVSGLCLSTGNANGLGEQRIEELYRSYQVLGVPEQRVNYLESIELPDGPNTVWNPSFIAKTIDTHINNMPGKVDAIISFDWRGVSEHPNHIAVYNGSSILAQKQKLPFYILPTLEVWEKYTAMPVAVWDSLMYAGSPPRAVANKAASYEPATEFLVLSSPIEYVTNVQAMLKHRSQLEWYRLLYLAFSRYMHSSRLVLWDEGMEARALLEDEE